MGRWDAFFAGDLAAAYEYFSPAYRSSVSLMQYQRSVFNNKVSWSKAEVSESDCRETTCNVKLSLTYTVIAAVPGLRSFSSNQGIEETWVLVNGVWYMVPKN